MPLSLRSAPSTSAACAAAPCAAAPIRELQPQDPSSLGVLVCEGQFTCVSLSSDQQVAAVADTQGGLRFYHLHSLMVAGATEPFRQEAFDDRIRQVAASPRPSCPSGPIYKPKDPACLLPPPRRRIWASTLPYSNRGFCSSSSSSSPSLSSSSSSSSLFSCRCTWCPLPSLEQGVVESGGAA